MKDKKLDRLFSQGLDEFETTPSAAAWDEVQGALKKKKKGAMLFWTKIAASVVLLFLLSLWIFYPKDVRPNENRLAVDKTILKEEVEGEDDKRGITEKRRDDTEKLTDNTQKVAVKRPVIDRVILAAAPTLVDKILNTGIPTASDLISDIPENKNTLIDNSLAVNSIEDDVKSEKEEVKFLPITITYSSSKSIEILANNTEPEKKDNLFKKVLSKAGKIKKEDISIAALRESKDQLLAFGKKSLEPNTEIQ